MTRVISFEMPSTFDVIRKGVTVPVDMEKIPASAFEILFEKGISTFITQAAGNSVAAAREDDEGRDESFFAENYMHSALAKLYLGEVAGRGASYPWREHSRAIAENALKKSKNSEILAAFSQKKRPEQLKHLDKILENNPALKDAGKRVWEEEQRRLREESTIGADDLNLDF